MIQNSFTNRRDKVLSNVKSVLNIDDYLLKEEINGVKLYEPFNDNNLITLLDISQKYMGINNQDLVNLIRMDLHSPKDLENLYDSVGGFNVFAKNQLRHNIYCLTCLSVEQNNQLSFMNLLNVLKSPEVLEAYFKNQGNPDFKKDEEYNKNVFYKFIETLPILKYSNSFIYSSEYYEFEALESVRKNISIDYFELGTFAKKVAPNFSPNIEKTIFTKVVPLITKAYTFNKNFSDSLNSILKFFENQTF